MIACKHQKHIFSNLDYFSLNFTEQLKVPRNGQVISIRGICGIKVYEMPSQIKIINSWIRDACEFGQNFPKCLEISWKCKLSYSFVQDEFNKISWKQEIS